jgi:membrane protein YqaA with SNARE-associated domain
MFNSLYPRVRALAEGPHAERALAAIAFAESSFFPIPPDVLLAPMALANPKRAWRYALIATIASVIGGMLGYAIGVWLAPRGHTILALFGHPQGQAEFHEWFSHWGVWIILVKGLTPIPYKLVTITAGLARFDLFTFVWASILTRGARFFLSATLLKYFGPAIRAEVERRLGLYTGLFLVLLVGVVVAMKVFG